MHSNRLTGFLFALLALGLIIGAALLSGAPQIAAAPLPILTQSAEPPTRTPSPPATATPVVPSATATPVVPSATTTSVVPPGTATPVVPGTATPVLPPATATATPPDSNPTDTPLFADPSVVKTVDRPGVAVGELLTFTIIVTSEGNVPAEGVIVEDTLPAYLEYVSASIERGQVVTNGQTVGFWIGQVAPGEVIRGEIVARVISFPEGGIGTNVAVLRSESPTDRPENNRSSSSFRVSQPAPAPPGDSPGDSSDEATTTPTPGLDVTPTPGLNVTPTPGVEVTPPPAGGEQPAVTPPTSLPITAGRAVMPYGLILLVSVTYMGLGLYLWLRPRRRK